MKAKEWCHENEVLLQLSEDEIKSLKLDKESEERILKMQKKVSEINFLNKKSRAIKPGLNWQTISITCS